MAGKGDIVKGALDFTAKLLSEGGEEAAKTGIRAYHGSPHSFDKFDMSKIGTGEGAQAYGHGLYFADREGIARSYRDALATGVKPELRPTDKYSTVGWKAEAEKLFPNDRERQAAFHLFNQMKNKDYVLENHDFITSLPHNQGKPYEWEGVEFTRDRLAQLADEFYDPGHMYEVNIAADPNAFLDYDKPLTEQSQQVRDALKKHYGFTYGSKEQQGWTGKDVAEMSAMQPEHVQELTKAGIPGIRYLDAGSRGAGDGSRNYVVFDDKLVSIIRKYGIAGASAMLGYNLMERLDPKQALAATMADNDYKSSVLVDEGDDVNNALRLAKDIGGATTENPQVFLTDAKGRQYDAQGNPIQPAQTQAQSNSAATQAAPTPEQVGRRAAEDPATFDAMMERYAVPDRDIADYEALQKEVAQQPQQVQQMTHVGAPPMRDIKVDMPLFGGERSVGQAPYNVANPMSGVAQTAYDLKTVPLYFTPWTAPIGAGLDVAEGVATGDPTTASLAIAFGPGSRVAKAAGIGAANYFIEPSEAEAGPARWFSKAMEVAREIPMNKMTGEQALAMLRKGTSPEEIRLTGADVFLQGKPTVTKDELVDYLNKTSVQSTQSGIRAYQGSPHNFAAERLVRFPEGRTEYIVGQPNVLPDVPEGAEVLQDFPLGRMRMDKIGTGEGAQAYGHGLYLAENERVAGDYRKNLSYKNIKDKFLDELPQDADFADVEDLMAAGHFSPEETRFLTELRNNDWLGYDYPSQAISAATRGKLADYDVTSELQDAAAKLGHQYEVEINADPNAFLDWDKPLSEQPSLTRALGNYDPEYYVDYDEIIHKAMQSLQPVREPTGEDIYRALGHPKTATRMLNTMGVPGIRFLDAGSRVYDDTAIGMIKNYGSREKALEVAQKRLASAHHSDRASWQKTVDALSRPETRNLVVFDDKLISIIRKYGIAGASAMIGYNLMENMTPEQAKAAAIADDYYQKTTETKMQGGRVTGGNTYDNDPSVAHALALTSEY